jgi:ATP-dependent Clp protease ATP-binding subunit ClpC
MKPLIDFSSPRYKAARYSTHIGRKGYIGLITSGSICLCIALVLIFLKPIAPVEGILAALALTCFLPAIWWKQYLSILPPSGSGLTDRLDRSVLSLLTAKMELNPRLLWQVLQGNWQAIFFTNHLLLNSDQIITCLSTDPTIVSQIFTIATNLADEHQTETIELGFVIAGLFLITPELNQLLTKQRMQAEDIKAIADWLGRNLSQATQTPRYSGGIGRDWVFGFTPLLDKLGDNISLAIHGRNSHFDWLARSPGVQAIEAAFNNRSTAIAVVGPTGIGKTSHVYALAQALMTGNSPESLRFHQIIGLNAMTITSIARSPGELEGIMIRLVNEADRAGHIILFLDNAQLFLTSSAGAVDISQILLSIIEASSVPLILALTPHDYQSLKANNPSLAGLLTPVMLSEMAEPDVMRVLEDTASGLEFRFHSLIAYEAIKEAYSLSGRYDQDEAYPGKAIKLLEQAVNHADHGIVSRESVDRAIEQTYGVKASTAEPAEADALLHLEDLIHRRMINQNHAVHVVASSLRRARAGVTNPNRPIGSFLFLGPTGVGKTELARSIAAIYFKTETSMIRLDMSEYQQPDDVQRLLETGVTKHSSLLMQIRQQPFSVVLLDEIEKANTNILNLLLQLIDEGQLTDSSGRSASFKDSIIIATSNAGSETIRQRIMSGQSLENFTKTFSDELIASGQFKPELINRFDELVLFRPLTPEELAQVVNLMLGEVNKTLSAQNISVELTPTAIAKIVEVGNDPRLGARPIRRQLQRTVEDTLAQLILEGKAQAGDHVIMDTPDLKF